MRYYFKKCDTHFKLFHNTRNRFYLTRLAYGLYPRRVRGLYSSESTTGIIVLVWLVPVLNLIVWPRRNKSFKRENPLPARTYIHTNETSCFHCTRARYTSPTPLTRARKVRDLSRCRFFAEASLLLPPGCIVKYTVPHENTNRARCFARELLRPYACSRNMFVCVA